VLLICLIVGSPLAGLGVQWFGKWCLGASSDVYGRKRMIGALRKERGHWGKFCLCTMIHCIYGQQCMCLLCQLVLVQGQLLVRWFLLYTSSILGTPYDFNEIGLLLIRKKKQEFSIHFNHKVPSANHLVFGIKQNS
jgi:hypothetical protein